MRGSRTTRAPARSAFSAVPSREPSSATITSAVGNASRSAATVTPIVCSSSRAATRIAAGSLTRAELLERRQDVVGVVDAVVAGLGPGEQEREGEPSGGQVDVVDDRQLRAFKGVDCGRVVRRALDSDCRGSRRRKALVNAGEESRGVTLLRTGVTGHDDSLQTWSRPPSPLDDEMLGERVPGRSVPAEDEFLGHNLAQLPESILPSVARESRTAREVTV